MCVYAPLYVRALYHVVNPGCTLNHFRFKKKYQCLGLHLQSFRCNCYSVYIYIYIYFLLRCHWCTILWRFRLRRYTQDDKVLPAMFCSLGFFPVPSLCSWTGRDGLAACLSSMTRHTWLCSLHWFHRVICHHFIESNLPLIFRYTISTKEKIPSSNNDSPLALRCLPLGDCKMRKKVTCNQRNQFSVSLPDIIRSLKIRNRCGFP